MVDTTFVAPVTNMVNTVFSSYPIQYWVTTVIVAIVTFVFGLLKTPKKTAALILKYAMLVIQALIDSTEKEVIGQITDNQCLSEYAASKLHAYVKNDADSKPLSKISKVFGGVKSAVVFAYPIVKPFLKSDKIIKLFKRGK